MPVGTLIAGLVSAGAIAVTVRENARVHRLGPEEPERATADLRLGTAADAEAALRRTFPDADGALDALARGAPATARAVAGVNEQLSDVERELRSGGEIPRSAVRMALFSATFGAVVELVTGMSNAPGSALAAAGVAFLVGCAGGAACFEIGRRRTARADRVRAEWDAVAQALAARLAGRSPPAQ